MIVKDMFNLANSHRALAWGALFALAAIVPACDAADPELDDDALATAELHDDAFSTTEYDPELAANRTFVCGYALPGYNCDNGRRSAYVTAANLTAARAACPASQPAGYTDFCYVSAADGGMSSDVTECSASSGSWRPGNSCCNYKGTKSCPVTRRYTCGYALPGYNCNNGRRSATITATDMTAALTACPASQPAGYTDFCYVIDADGGTAADTLDCTDASGSWRPGNSCCNFMGTLSCP
jgi:hypothetical protein